MDRDGSPEKEEVDEECRVRLKGGIRRREGAEGREQEQDKWGSQGGAGDLALGANRKPLCRKEQEEQLRQGRGERKWTDMRSHPALRGF